MIEAKQNTVDDAMIFACIDYKGRIAVAWRIWEAPWCRFRVGHRGIAGFSPSVGRDGVHTVSSLLTFQEREQRVIAKSRPMQFSGLNRTCVNFRISELVVSYTFIQRFCHTPSPSDETFQRGQSKAPDPALSKPSCGTNVV